MPELKTKITGALLDKSGRAVKITTEHEDGSTSEIMLSADFCHYCIDDLADEFRKFMKKKGHKILQGKR
jgi:hypothetical protein